jgi:methionyl-tRNA formyltransferase
MENFNLVFMSSSSFGIPTLEKLLKSSHNISAVYTQPSKKSGRGLNINSSPIYQIAESYKKIIRTPFNLSDEDELLFFDKIKPDLVIVVSYGIIIPNNMLSLPKYGFMNIHPSLLPNWRGAAPIQRSLINGDKKTGVNIIKLDDGLDTGDICKSHEIMINSNDNFQTLSSKLSEIGSQMIMEAIDDILNKKIIYWRQSNENISYAKKIDKKEAKISFKEPASNIINLIRGLSPNPGAWFLYNDLKKPFRVKILEAKIMDNTGTPGELLDDELLIACGDKSIKPLTLQREGKKPMSLGDFLRGSRIKKGIILNSE